MSFMQGWIRGETLDPIRKAKIQEGGRVSCFAFYGLNLLDGCLGVRQGRAHTPHQTDGRFCLGQGGIVEGKNIIIVVEDRPVPTVQGSAKGFWVSKPVER